LQARLNPHSQPRVQRYGTTYAPGDKVLQRVNNYDKEVFNGDIGWITALDLEQSVLTVDFDGRGVEYEFAELDELSLAYAASIHKSQGSEYPVVVIPLAMQHFTLLERNLLYTAVTRGRKLVVVIAEPQALGDRGQTAGVQETHHPAAGAVGDVGVRQSGWAGDARRSASRHGL
jgi:exodeoxyribonuclease V alpha subunit